MENNKIRNGGISVAFGMTRELTGGETLSADLTEICICGFWVTFCATGKDIDKYLDTFSENYLGLEDGALFDFND